jgi:hypothetical protein
VPPLVVPVGDVAPPVPLWLPPVGPVPEPPFILVEPPLFMLVEPLLVLPFIVPPFMLPLSIPLPCIVPPCIDPPFMPIVSVPVPIDPLASVPIVASVPVPIMEVSSVVPSSEELLPQEVVKRPRERASSESFRSFMFLWVFWEREVFEMVLIRSEWVG